MSHNKPPNNATALKASGEDRHDNRLFRIETMREMTERQPNTPYVPIPCARYSEYELAILHRQRLRLVWSDGNVIHDQTVLPLDLRTMKGDDSTDGGGTTPRTDDSTDGGGRTASGTAVEEVERRRERLPEQPPRTASGDCMDAGGRATPGAVAGTAVEEFLVFRAEDGQARELRLDRVQRVYPA